MGSEFYDARDWEKELEDAKKALAAALKRERSWEGEAKSLRRAWERETEQCSTQRRRVNELRYEVENRHQENIAIAGREKSLEKELLELRMMMDKNVRQLGMEKERSAWFERRVNELENVIKEWERKDAVQKEKEYKERLEKEKRERMEAEIRERVEVEERIRYEMKAAADNGKSKKRKVFF